MSDSLAPTSDANEGKRPHLASQEVTITEPDETSPALPKATGAELRGNRYVTIQLHDQGGMGRVWVARDTALGRDVALKEIRPERTDDPAALARFVREARITGRLEHPGIVPVYDLIHAGDEAAFYTMRFVGGRTLTRAVREYHENRQGGADATLDLSALLHAFVVVCNTLAFAHARGVIHRDLKGDNVVLGEFGEVVVLDWGLAKVLDGGGADEHASNAPVEEPADADLTMVGQLLGTPAYMAPEQVEGRLDRIDHRTDIYGLGAILYQILTGRPPFIGAGTVEVLRRVREDEPAPPRELCADVPPGLESICMQALAKKPEDRHATAKDLADAIQRWQEAERRQAEEALRASEEQYRSLADLIPGVVWTARADGGIDYANQYWFNFTGMTWEQTQGNGWAAMLHSDDLPRVIQAWTSALQTGEPYEIQYRLKRAADGAFRWFLAQARPLRDREGHVVKWFGMLTEIEDQVLERKRAGAELLSACEESHQ